jgi:hypothetical protein
LSGGAAFLGFAFAAARRIIEDEFFHLVWSVVLLLELCKKNYFYRGKLI